MIGGAGRRQAPRARSGLAALDGPMPEVRHTDIEVANPSTLPQRIQAAQRQASSEVADDERPVNLSVGDKGTQLGDDSRLWWSLTYEVRCKP
jgi:hypothetical protein